MSGYYYYCVRWILFTNWTVKTPTNIPTYVQNGIPVNMHWSKTVFTGPNAPFRLVKWNYSIHKQKSNKYQMYFLNQIIVLSHEMSFASLCVSWHQLLIIPEAVTPSLIPRIMTMNSIHHLVVYCLPANICSSNNPAGALFQALAAFVSFVWLLCLHSLSSAAQSLRVGDRKSVV